MNFSELRPARERLGLSLRDIAERTKIREAILRAIENNEIDRLPPPIFTRGFVKAYAREVGLDPRELVESSTNSPRMVPARAADDRAAADAEFEDRSEQYNLSERDTSSLVTVALIVAAGLLFILTDPWTASTPAADSAASSSTEAAATHGTAVDGDGAVATAGSARPAAGSLTRNPNMRLELMLQGPCWIEATVDGERVIYRLLDAGDRYAIEGYDDLVLKVGDPAALAFSLNGSAGRQLGPAGQPVTVHITRGNSREFLVGSGDHS
jgi:cytoskeletal protein RodZ